MSHSFYFIILFFFFLLKWCLSIQSSLSFHCYLFTSTCLWLHPYLCPLLRLCCCVFSSLIWSHDPYLFASPSLPLYFSPSPPLCFSLSLTVSIAVTCCVSFNSFFCLSTHTCLLLHPFLYFSPSLPLYFSLKETRYRISPVWDATQTLHGYFTYS